MTFKIDDDVPMPADGRGRTVLYPFRSLKVGQSFFVECIPAKADSIAGCGIAAAKREGPPWKFARRKEGSGYRFWRVS